MLPPAAIITWLFLCIETLNEIHLNMATAWLPGFRWEAKDPGACGWPVFSHKSIFPPARSWRARDGAQMWACACESVCQNTLYFAPLCFLAPRDTQFLPCKLLKVFCFCCFLNMDFIPKFGVSHVPRDTRWLCSERELKERHRSCFPFLSLHAMM